VILAHAESRTRERFTRVLRAVGQDVTAVDSADEAVARARKEAPDVVLVDVALGDADALLAELKGDPNAYRAAVVLVERAGLNLEAAVGALRRGGRVALCGAVSEYETPGLGPANLFRAVTHELSLRGFRGSSHVDRLGAVQRELAGWIRAGRLRCTETVLDGLERAPEALALMLAGATRGKTLVRLG
jgi:NADPH-dependent curcumin reductase CurA